MMNPLLVYKEEQKLSWTDLQNLTKLPRWSLLRIGKKTREDIPNMSINYYLILKDALKIDIIKWFIETK